MSSHTTSPTAQQASPQRAARQASFKSTNPFISDDDHYENATAITSNKRISTEESLPPLSSPRVPAMAVLPSTPERLSKPQRHISFANRSPINSTPSARSWNEEDEAEDEFEDVFPSEISANNSKLRLTSASAISAAAGHSTEVSFESESYDDEGFQVQRKPTVMKRTRWGTQRHKKGRPTTPKRSRSIFSRNASGTTTTSDNHHHGTMHNNDSSDSLIDEPPQSRKIYFNTPLPSDMVQPDTGLPIVDYPRNKIRTTKYTPLSFIPKNLFFQFHNVANVYFLFIVILGVSRDYF